MVGYRVGRRAVVGDRIEQLGLRIRIDKDLELVDPERDDRYHEYWTHYYRLMARNGVSPDLARRIMRTRTSAIGAMMVRRGDADAVICGAIGQFQTHLRHIREIIGTRKDVRDLSASGNHADASGDPLLIPGVTPVEPASWGRVKTLFLPR